MVPDARVRRIALFDLDGTLTRRDTLMPYLLGFGARAPVRLLRLLISLPGALFHYVFRERDRGQLKETLIKAALAGTTRAQIARWNEKLCPASAARRYALTGTQAGCSTSCARRLPGAHVGKPGPVRPGHRARPRLQ